MHNQESDHCLGTIVCQAVAIAALNLLDQDDIKKLMKTDLIPQWVQFPEMERVSGSFGQKPRGQYSVTVPGSSVEVTWSILAEHNFLKTQL